MRGKVTLAVAVTGAFLAVTPAAHAECVDADLRASSSDVPRMTSALFCLHNEERAAAGLPALRWSTHLARAATGHSGDMVARSYFDHYTPEGLSPFDRMEAADYGADAFDWRGGENIAWATGEAATPGATMKRWMASPVHRENVLRDTFRDVGFGVVFGSPKPGAVPEPVTYTVNFGWREFPDDASVTAGPGEPPQPPPVEAPDDGGEQPSSEQPSSEPQPDAPAATGEPAPATPRKSRAQRKKEAARRARMRKCMRKAKRKARPAAAKRARARCHARHGKRKSTRR